MIWSKQFFYYDVWNGCMVIRLSRRLLRASVYVVEISSGSTSIMMMSSPCRINGSIHGMLHGILHFSGRFDHVDPEFAKAQLVLHDGNGICTRMDSCRLTNGISVMLIHLSMLVQL